MFHVPVVVVVLGEMMVVSLVASSWTWLSLPGVIGLHARGLRIIRAHKPPCHDKAQHQGKN